jgi:3-oxoadipate enol-lactonase
MAFTQNHGVRIHWQAQGAGTPVLLIMGHRYSSAMWYPALPALSAAHRVLWFDNRGTGETDSVTGFTVADMAADALAVMDAAGVQKAHVYGVSMGGGIALELAKLAPERVISLVLGCTAILTADKPRMPAILRLAYYLPPWILKLLLPRPKEDDQGGYGRAARPEDIARDMAMLKQDRFVTRGVVAQAAAIGGYCNTREAVAALAMPALVLHGDQDRVVPYAWGEELAATLPGARLVTLEGSGHNFLVAGRDKANAAVLDFLREVDGRAA